jgi:putative flippase GtrA
MLKKVILQFLQIFYPLFKKLMPYQLYAYLAVGAINTVLNIALFAFFYQLVLPKEGCMLMGNNIASYTISLLMAFAITVPTGYWLAKHFAFNDQKVVDDASAKQLGKYFLVVLQGLLSDYLIMKGLIVFCKLEPTVAKIISTVIVLTFNYLLQKYFTFKTKTA